MISAAFTGLDMIARCIDASNGRVGYIVLERPNGRHENVRVARVNLDASSLREFMPGAIATALRRSSSSTPTCSALAEAAVGWLRQQMERSMGRESEVTFKVNLWQHKGVELEFAPRVVARREIGVPLGGPPSFTTSPAVDDPADLFVWILIVATTQGLAAMNEQIARAEGRIADAEREAAVALGCLQCGLTLVGFGAHAATLGPPPPALLASANRSSTAA
ncbi:MAG: hypothetical protein ACOZNI_27920 [Myxococcota bacterium]